MHSILNTGRSAHVCYGSRRSSFAFRRRGRVLRVQTKRTRGNSAHYIIRPVRVRNNDIIIEVGVGALVRRDIQCPRRRRVVHRQLLLFVIVKTKTVQTTHVRLFLVRGRIAIGRFLNVIRTRSRTKLESSYTL